jgi:hypothetical protein
MDWFYNQGSQIEDALPIQQNILYFLHWPWMTIYKERNEVEYSMDIFKCKYRTNSDALSKKKKKKSISINKVCIYYETVCSKYLLGHL